MNFVYLRSVRLNELPR